MMTFFRNIISDHVKANQFAALFRFMVTLITGIILVRSEYTDTQVGEFEYAVLIAYTCSFFISFAYSSGILSKMPKIPQLNRSNSWGDLIWQIIIIAIIVSIISFIGINLLLQYGIIDIKIQLSGVLSLFIFLLISGSLNESYYLLNKKGKSLLSFTLVVYLLQLVSVTFIAFYQLNILYVLWVYIGIHGLKLIWTFYLVKPKFIINWNAQKAWFLFITPLFLHFLLGSGMDYVDGHLVARYFSDETFLYYRYGARELPLSFLFVNALSAAMIPILAESKENINQLKSRITRLMHILYPISILFLFIGPQLFIFFYGENFVLSGLIFNVYLLIITSRIITPQILMYAHQDNKALVVFSAIELVVNVVLSIILINSIGVVGVAIATVLAFLFNKLLSVIYCFKQYGIAFKDYINIPLYFAYTSALVLGFYLSYLLIFQ